MKRKIMVWIIWPLLLLFSIVGAGAQGEMERLENFYFDTPRRPAAPFAHDNHNERAAIEECNVCHHVFDQDGMKSEYESSEDQTCAECHALQDDGSIPALRRAFHQRCRGCHLTLRQGPVVCASCHPR